MREIEYGAEVVIRDVLQSRGKVRVLHNGVPCRAVCPRIFERLMGYISAMSGHANSQSRIHTSSADTKYSMSKHIIWWSGCSTAPVLGDGCARPMYAALISGSESLASFQKLEWSEWPSTAQSGTGVYEISAPHATTSAAKLTAKISGCHPPMYIGRVTHVLRGVPTPFSV